ncbi:MAG: hypothetical protein ACKV2Q_33510, partial [Planctomycetaceae bacterium]
MGKPIAAASGLLAMRESFKPDLGASSACGETKRTGEPKHLLFPRFGFSTVARDRPKFRGSPSPPIGIADLLTVACCRAGIQEIVGLKCVIARYGLIFASTSGGGVSYTRLWNSELIEMIRDVATDFTPPQIAVNGGTGLYCGEQDMFCFLIDPTGWIDIDGESFAPGFFVWNSEVGRRSLGMQSFWFQRVCQNHIVWDATQVVE